MLPKKIADFQQSLKICRAEARSDAPGSLRDIPCATASVVFVCCPHQEGAGVSLSEAVGNVLTACEAPNSRLLLDSLQGNIEALKSLHEDFLAFAPMLTVWTV